MRPILARAHLPPTWGLPSEIEVLYERMIQRLSHAPATLDEIRDRLGNDEIVD